MHSLTRGERNLKRQNPCRRIIEVQNLWLNAHFHPRWGSHKGTVHRIRISHVGHRSCHGHRCCRFEVWDCNRREVEIQHDRSFSGGAGDLCVGQTSDGLDSVAQGAKVLDVVICGDVVNEAWIHCSAGLDVPASDVKWVGGFAVWALRWYECSICSGLGSCTFTLLNYQVRCMFLNFIFENNYHYIKVKLLSTVHISRR